VEVNAGIGYVRIRDSGTTRGKERDNIEWEGSQRLCNPRSFKISYKANLVWTLLDSIQILTLPEVLC
jgi:hypothetical protein